MTRDLTFLFAAYGVIWVLLFGYLFSLARRWRQVRLQLDALQEELQQNDRIGI